MPLLNFPYKRPFYNLTLTPQEIDVGYISKISFRDASVECSYSAMYSYTGGSSSDYFKHQETAEKIVTSP